MLKILVSGLTIFTVTGGIMTSGMWGEVPEQKGSAQSIEIEGQLDYYGYKDLKSLALAWYDNGYTNLDNPKEIPVDKINGLPIGLSKDDYVKFVVEQYGEESGNSASQVTFLHQ
ncbi:hypothetical protein ACQKGI_18540 [Peribacillus muralis]|uniref:hypothetical protein n=1 Tax=Peribacillus muralis TaxID=264697 RepID=UPI0037FF0198